MPKFISDENSNLSKFMLRYKDNGVLVDVTNDPDLEDPPNTDKEELLQPCQVIPDWLWLAGEDEVHLVLPHVDVWIDFRHYTPNSRRIFVPDHIHYIRMPLVDGDLEAAQIIFPAAKALIKHFRDQEKKILVSCHAGVSRSATLCLWILAEQYLDFDKAWEHMKAIRPYFSPDEGFQPLLDKIRREMNDWKEIMQKLEQISESFSRLENTITRCEEKLYKLTDRLEEGEKVDSLDKEIAE